MMSTAAGHIPIIQAGESGVWGLNDSEEGGFGSRCWMMLLCCRRLILLKTLDKKKGIK